ncbi:disulfide oxidoreductase [Piscibacillus sp. B03]|uniref:disulfide oxidoreductase n=1 Tax=Piscibacillus sp. B03 TaxID=3457430 RepID=UPI003FCE0902
MDIKLILSFLISLVASLGSLYFSEVMGYIPCELCWYQRILMYPLVFLLGIAFIKGDKGIKVYVLPFVFLGLILSAYHYITQRISVNKLTSCFIGGNCNNMYIDVFGFITIPFLSFIAFTSLSMLLISIKN